MCNQRTNAEPPRSTSLLAWSIMAEKKRIMRSNRMISRPLKEARCFLDGAGDDVLLCYAFQLHVGIWMIEFSRARVLAVLAGTFAILSVDILAQMSGPEHHARTNGPEICPHKSTNFAHAGKNTRLARSRKHYSDASQTVANSEQLCANSHGIPD